MSQQSGKWGCGGTGEERTWRGDLLHDLPREDPDPHGAARRAGGGAGARREERGAGPRAELAAEGRRGRGGGPGAGGGGGGDDGHCVRVGGLLA